MNTLCKILKTHSAAMSERGGEAHPLMAWATMGKIYWWTSDINGNPHHDCVRPVVQ